MMDRRTTGRTASLLIVLASTAFPSRLTAQDWLLGQHRGDAGGGVTVKAKYRADGSIRVDTHGGPFAGREVARATLVRLAEMTHDKRMPRFAIRKEQCWQI